VEAKGFDPATVMDRIKNGDVAWLSMDFFIALYKSYLDDFGPVWGEVIRLAAYHDNYPLVFHCTGGKDRTGVCATLMLKALGVPEASIIADHNLSNIYNAERLKPIYDKFKSMGVEAERVAPYLQAPIEPLTAMLEHLNKNYGTIENYLLTKAGLDRKTLMAFKTALL
jgi:protein-tyrosine phosphatase